jgi:tRNA (guanine-N7-)-methyltransferase
LTGLTPPLLGHNSGLSFVGHCHGRPGEPSDRHGGGRWFRQVILALPNAPFQPTVTTSIHPAAPEADDSDVSTTPRRGIRSFVLRAGRMGTGQQRALDMLGPRFVLPFSAKPLDAPAIFGRTAPLVLEIGFGMGAATAQIAADRPDTDFIGVEVHTPGVGALLKRIGEMALPNLRIVQHDAVQVLQEMVAPASLAGVHVFFPDPWHKKKHHKRRLIQPPLIALLASRLAPGGVLHCATDWQPYAEQMLEVLSAEPLLENTAATYARRPDYRPLTKFEARGLKLGHGVWDLLFHRR